MTLSVLKGPRFQKEKQQVAQLGTSDDLIHPSSLSCTCKSAQTGSPTHLSHLIQLKGLQFKQFRKCLVTSCIQFTSKAGLSPTSLLLTYLSKVCTTRNVHSAKETDFGRIVCFGEEEKSQQRLRSREQTASWPISALYNQHSGISPAHSKEWLVWPYYQAFPPISCSPSSLGKSRQFPAPPLLLTHVSELLLASPSLHKKKTVGSTTSDLPQPAGCHPKFYMETCESILLAPEVKHAPASF